MGDVLKTMCSYVLLCIFILLRRNNAWTNLEMKGRAQEGNKQLTFHCVCRVVCVCVCLHWMVGCFYLPLIERIKKIKIKKERKATIPMLLPNVFLNASDPTFNFKLFKSISLMGPNLVLTCLGQLKSAGSVAP